MPMGVKSTMSQNVARLYEQKDMLSSRPMRIDRAAEDRVYRTARILWLAFTIAIVLYFLMCLFIKPVAIVTNNLMEHALMAVSIAYVLISLPIKRWSMTQAGQLESLLLKRFALFVPMVACEAAALTGLALRLVTGYRYFYVFLLLALGGMLINYPKRPE